ncbi:MAG: hypothetical protein PUC23_02490 [bacterium]|nr:hypothetical protein [bacterium]
MIKLSDYVKEVIDKNIDKVVMVKYGNFYRCSYNDALIMSYLFNYKITNRNTVGFPINTLNNVLDKLKDNKISCVVVYEINNVISYVIIDNKYMEVLDKAIKYDNVKEAVKVISELSYEILNRDIRKLHKIMLFLRNL